MTCPTEPTELLLDALRRHPLAAMTLTELVAKVRPLPTERVTEALAALRARHAVVTHTLATPDPHLPAIEAVALVRPAADDSVPPHTDAAHRAARCAQVLQRQLLRSHRCQ